jgi:hypothetical protein
VKITDYEAFAVDTPNDLEIANKMV